MLDFIPIQPCTSPPLQYPLETVTTVLRIADSAEVYFDFRQHHDLLVAEQFDVSEGIQPGSFCSGGGSLT